MGKVITADRKSERQDSGAAPAVVRVLLIDDDPAYQSLCQRYLLRISRVDYQLDAVATGLAGLEKSRKGEYDCVLVDYSLPDLRGSQVISALQKTMSEDAPPAIILTACGGEMAATEAVRSGAADFLSKRILSAESLSRAIDNAVEKGRLKTSVAVRSRKLKQANLALQSRTEHINRFYHTMSHEVKTPLTAAREFISIVLDGIAGPVSEQQSEMLTHALESCDQIAAHFNDLIEMTRLETGKISLRIKPTLLDVVVTRCLAGAAVAMESKNLVFVRDYVLPLPLVNVDGNRIIQVLSNLLGNAIKFTAAGGTITLSIYQEEPSGVVTVTVADSGCGITPADLPRVFDRLYQVSDESGDATGPGLGLGLSIAKEIIELHGGDLTAHSVLGEGSAFTFRLPASVSAIDDKEVCNEIHSVG